MRISYKTFAAVLLVTLLASTASTFAEEPELIPRDVIFGYPTQFRARISPDGTMLSYVAPYEGMINVWVQTIGEDDARPVTTDTERPIYAYFWQQDSGHILYTRDFDGDENDHVYRVDIATGETTDLTPFEGVKVNVSEHNKHHPDKIVLSMNKENPELFDVYLMDLNTLEMEKIAENPGNVIGWDLDMDLNVRGANAISPESDFLLLVRDDVNSEWRELVRWGFEELNNSTSLYFTGDGDHMYLKDSRDSNTARLVEIDIHTGDIEVVGSDPEYDLSNIMLHPDTREVQAYSFYMAREEWVVVDENIRADFEALATLDRGDFNILDRSNDDMTWMVAYDKDNASSCYYVYDRVTKTGEKLFDTRPGLNKYELAPMEPITYTARDGLEIEGYATFPPGKERKNLPTVLYVHGGPVARDIWGLEPFTQTMANRGYLVLQVNYRGSDGYGKEFIAISEKEWGGTMQDDLTDAVSWAAEQGWSDPDKVCIMGMSYGGYAALVGATFTPDLYACAISAMGPSNLNTFMLTIPPYWKPFEEVMFRRIGNPHTEQDFLESRSPIFKVDRIKTPMLLSYGVNDPRVNIAEGEQIVAELKEKGIEYEYLVYENEGHGFMQEYNRIHFLANVEKFLAEHLGGRFEPWEGE